MLNKSPRSPYKGFEEPVSRSPTSPQEAAGEDLKEYEENVIGNVIVRLLEER